MQPIHKKILILSAFVVFAVALFAGSATAFAAPTFNRPINNSTHIANSISLSTTAFPSGASAAVVTSADSYAESLTAAVLAKAYSGPLLLTSATSLSANVASELARLKPSKVFLVGLPSSFAASVKSAVSGLTDAGVVVLKGSDRYETAAKVATEVKAKVGTVSRVVIAPGDTYGAALAASSLAAAQGWPLLLMPTAGPLPQSATDAIGDMGVSSAIVVGTNANLGVSSLTISKRIVGSTSSSDSDGRYSTAADLAAYAVSQGWLSYSHLAIVPGDDYRDGQIAAAYIAKNKGVLLFSKTSALQAATSAAIKSNGPQVKKIDIVGLGWAVYREVKSLNSPRVTALSTTTGPTAGGNSVVVSGTALDKTTKVRVGKVDVPSGAWKADSGTKLTISSMPAGLGDGPAEVMVHNYWGASPSSTKDLYWYGGDGVLTPGEKVVKKAVEYLGVPYLWAGAGPTAGFDCSGFCMYVYKQFGVNLPHYSRSMATYGTAVSKENLQPGDLVFFYSPISHVGMYVGGGLMIHAPRSGDLVCIENAFRSGYVTARRMIPGGASTPDYTRYEQTDPLLAYSGAWFNSNTTSASGGNFRYSDTGGSSVTVAFNGTYLGLVAKKSNVYGNAKITVDGGTPVTVDLYSASTVYLQTVWNTGTLAAGDHTVVIEWTGTKNASSSGTNIGIDAVDLIGRLRQADAGTTPPASEPSGSSVRFEQTDSRFAYTGTWSNSTESSASGGNFRFANSQGASAVVNFTGTYFRWLAKKSDVYGIAKVTLDGKTCHLVDLYSAGTLHQQMVWETGTLEDGEHTVVIEWTGTKNASSSGTNIGIDAVELTGQPARAMPITPAPATTRYEQTESLIKYTGAWAGFSTAGASTGSYARAKTGGSTATIAFNGRYLAWIATKGTTLGKAKVSLDGGAPVTIDLAATAVAYQQKVWDTGVLSNGPHTVTISWDGDGTGKHVSIDAFDVNGTLTSPGSPATPPSTTPPPTTPAPQTTRYEQPDSRFLYEGRWTASGSTSASNGSFRFSNTAGSSMKVTFTGTYLAWIAKFSPVYGIAKVTLDDNDPVLVDLYSADTRWNARAWDTGTLPEGRHTVTIEWTGTRNATATNTNISVDAFDIAGTVEQPADAGPVAPKTSRYEQTDANFAFAGGWIASSSTKASNNSFRFANSPSSTLITFNGTYLAWIGKKSTMYGIAKVTVDKKAPVMVDLYSQTEVWQQRLWDTGVLAAGDHTVLIEWMGTKNASATATNLNVDAFEIAGTVTKAPAAKPTRYEQPDSHFAYAGKWTASGSTLASNGSLRFSNTAGSSVTVTFVGSHLAWITKKSPVYGMAKVTLDGRAPIIVDLYAAKDVHQQKVWETGALVPGTHTVRIEWTGTKNPAATNTNIGVDAFDIIGTLK